MKSGTITTPLVMPQSGSSLQLRSRTRARTRLSRCGPSVSSNRRPLGAAGRQWKAGAKDAEAAIDRVIAADNKTLVSS